MLFNYEKFKFYNRFLISRINVELKIDILNWFDFTFKKQTIIVIIKFVVIEF